MASAASIQDTPNMVNQSELDRLAADFFDLAETQLATMDPGQRSRVIESIHATAESLRAGK